MFQAASQATQRSTSLAIYLLVAIPGHQEIVSDWNKRADDSQTWVAAGHSVLGGTCCALLVVRLFTQSAANHDEDEPRSSGEKVLLMLDRC